ncbi:DMT family transporter [Rhodosalinus sediminis]|uniref:DMT family transporter n=1 Tax=Rhodosalinus sediminis TaxID=1940533 RepID=A0A3D9BVT7_9RHOB|nr:DMT family transporter [Rhodosalinus sediminis]REC57627.1 DMT family transporter [Rhodosalinus sediminis]
MSPTLRAALWMAGTVASFTGMAVAGRQLGGTLDTFEIMFYRSLVGLAIVVAAAAWTGRLAEVRTRRIGLHAARNLAHFTGQNLWFFAIPLIPLAQLVAFEFTSPIWVVLLSPLILGERLTVMRLVSATLGFLGILIVAQPGAAPLSVGQIAAAGAAVGFAFSAVFTRRLTRSETITCILFWMTAMQSVFGLVTAAADLDVAVPPLWAAGWLVVVGIAGLSAHFCLTTALSLAPAAVVMPMDFARLPVLTAVGMALYAEDLQWAVLIGAAVIFAANYLNIWAETRARRALP